MKGSLPTPHDLAYGGLFGAMALLLPTVFHLVHLGHVFMPMYLPLVALAFFVAPATAAGTALVVPLLSGLVTGMPPFYPPVAPIMSLELALMAGLIGVARRLFSPLSVWWILIPVLLIGRIVGFGLVYAFALIMDLPAGYVAGASLLSGWPGIVLMLIVIPPLVRLTGPNRKRAGERKDTP
ncbi:MAG: ECF transporter S component [Myxococcales bacterium]|nr:ECF transporter S component [Myxococcales bacterium]